MPIARFKMSDGRIARFEVPEGTTPEQAYSMMESHFSNEKQPKIDSPNGSMAERDAASKKDVEGAFSRIADFGKGAATGLADIGNTVINAGLYFPSKFSPEIDRWNKARNADMEYVTESNRDNNAFKLGRIGGNVGATLPVGGVIAQGVRAVAPGAPALANAIGSGGFRTGTQIANDASKAARLADLGTRAIGGGITGGASTALINPSDAGTGAAIGALLPPAVATLGKTGKAIGSSLAIGDNNKELAKKAISQYEIPLGVGDIADGATTKALRAILNDAPFSGGVGAAQRESVQEGFNRAVGNTFGAPEKKLTAQVVDQAKKRMGAEFDRLWTQNSLQVDPQMIDKINSLRSQAKKLPKNEGASLLAELDDLASKMVPDSTGNAVIPGDVANKFQSYLRRRVEGSSGLKNELGDLRQEIISAFNRGIKPEDAAALTSNRSQYKAFKTIEPLLNSAEAGVAGRLPGDVPAALLPQAVARGYSQPAGVPLSDLSQIGSRFLVDRTPRTGGSMRAALQNTALGTAIVGGGLTNPYLAVSAIPAATGLNVLLGSPTLAKQLLKDRSGGALSKLIEASNIGELSYKAAPVSISR